MTEFIYVVMGDDSNHDEGGDFAIAAFLDSDHAEAAVAKLTKLQDALQIRGFEYSEASRQKMADALKKFDPDYEVWNRNEAAMRFSWDAVLLYKKAVK